MKTVMKHARILLIVALSISLLVVISHPPALAGATDGTPPSQLGDATEAELLAAGDQTPLPIVFPPESIRNLLRGAAAVGAVVLLLQCALAGCAQEPDASLLSETEIAQLLKEHADASVSEPATS